MKLHEGFFRPFRQSDAQAQTAFIRQQMNAHTGLWLH